MPNKPMEFKVEGLASLDRMLKDLPGNLDDIVKGDALRAGGKVIAEDAKARVPVDTGELRDSIVVRKATKKQRRRGTGEVVIGFKKPASRRAHLVEFGTVTSHPRPFMRPAIDAKSPAAFAAVRDAVKDGVEKMEARLRGDFRKLSKRIKRSL